MCIEHWIPTITSTIASTSVLGIVLFLSKNLIINRLTQSVKHEYDSKLAELNALLEDEKKELQSIRDFVFNNLQQRQSLLYEKQLKAVDSIWEKTCKLSQGEMLCELVSGMVSKYDISKTIESNLMLQESFKIFSQTVNLKEMFSVKTPTLQPYLPELLYSYYKAYGSIIVHYVFLNQLFQKGLPDKFLKKEGIKELILSVLPDRKNEIEKHGIKFVGSFLEELREKILNEIKLFLDGESANNKDIQKMKEMKNSIKKINNINKDLEKKLDG